MQAGISRVEEGVAAMRIPFGKLAGRIGFPLVMKVVGPVHKSDVGGVALGIDNDMELMEHFQRMMTDRRSHRCIASTHAGGNGTFCRCQI